MHSELKRRLLEAEIKVLCQWNSERIMAELERELMNIYFPGRSPRDIYDHIACLVL